MAAMSALRASGDPNMWSARLRAFGFHVLTSPGMLSAFVAVACVLARARGLSVSRTRTRITAADTPRNAALLEACPVLHRYLPTPWLPGAHANTLFAALFRGSPSLTYTRTHLPTGDGGHVALDWHTLPVRGQPVLILLHGLTGGSQERYMQWMVREVSSRVGIACVVMNARGCSTSHLTSPRCFSAAWTHDLHCTVTHIRAIIGPDTPLFAVGFSLGAGILSKYVCERAHTCTLTAAVMACASLDMMRSTALLESWFMRHTYNRVLARALVGYLERHASHFTSADDVIDIRAARAARTVRDFDSATIVPMFGYDDVWHYYRDASTAPLLSNIRVPCLYLNADDDPICAASGIPDDAFRRNPHIISVRTVEGGHVAWCQGWWPRGACWADDAAVEYFREHLRIAGYAWHTTAGTQPLDVRVQLGGDGATPAGPEATEPVDADAEDRREASVPM